MNTDRDSALDAMRGLSVALMVEIHSLLHFRPVYGKFYLIMRALGTLAAPFFLICAGMGMEYLRGRWVGESARFRQAMVRRGLFLILFATLLHVYRLDIVTLFDWNIFSLIGLWYLLNSPFNRLPWFLPILLIAGILGLNALLPIGKPWILRDGSFPPVPFSVYFLLGILLTKARQTIHQLGRWSYLIGLGALVLLVVSLLHTMQLATLNRFDVWSIKGVMIISALFVILISTAWQFPKNTVMRDRVLWPFTQMGKLAFSLYYVQYFFLLFLPGVVRVLTGKDLILLWPSLVWSGLIFAFMVFLCGIVAIWERFRFKYSLEWFMSNYVSSRSRIGKQ